MPALSAHLGSVSVAGAAVSFTQQATNRLTANTRYQISNAGFRRLDPASAITIEVDADGAGAGAYVTASAETYDIDYLFGIVTFKSDQGTNALVRVSGKYLPVLQLGLLRSVSLSISNDVIDLNVLGDGYKRRAVMLRDLSGELNGLDLTTADLDASASVLTLQSYLESGAPLLMEVGKGSGAQILRAWVKVPELAHKLASGSLYEHTLKFQGHTFQGNGQDEYVAWGYGTP